MTLRQLLLTTTLLSALPAISQAAAVSSEADDPASTGARVAATNLVAEATQAMEFAATQLGTVGKAYLSVQQEASDLKNQNAKLKEEAKTTADELSAEKAAHAATAEALGEKSDELEAASKTLSTGLEKLRANAKDVSEAILMGLLSETDLFHRPGDKAHPRRIDGASSIETVMQTITHDLEPFFEALPFAKTMVRCYAQYCEETDAEAISSAIEDESENAVAVEDLQNTLSGLFTVRTVEELKGFKQETFASTLQKMQELLERGPELPTFTPKHRD